MDAADIGDLPPLLRPFSLSQPEVRVHGFTSVFGAQPRADPLGLGSLPVGNGTTADGVGTNGIIPVEVKLLPWQLDRASLTVKQIIGKGTQLRG